MLKSAGRALARTVRYCSDLLVYCRVSNEAFGSGRAGCC